MGFKKYSTRKKREEHEFKCEVLDKFGVLDSDMKYPRELRLVKWGDDNIKYDLRSWGVDKNGNEIPYGGTTFDAEELYSLYEILKKMNEENEEEGD